MSKYIAKYKSYGFRNKFWDKNEIADSVTLEEELNPLLCHFSKVSKLDPKVVIPEINPREEGIPLSLLGLQQEFFTKFNKEVPARYKNDITWITKKLSEEA